MGHEFLTKSGLDGRAAKEAVKSVEGHFLVTASSVELELLSSRLFSDLMYIFAWDDTYQRAIHENPIIGTTLSKETVADWFSYYRETIAVAWQNTSTENIGDAGMEVQVDESKIGHWKYNRGR
ncbi:hypothetical protein HHI36_009928 [Cryptolaemus montrouzieri]|uniref:Uncharacterized protein n=1 Tax=Cryptolaemus montrouzieri TaxID=559131 RepID=A0ABD2MHB8_9CUCU